MAELIDGQKISQDLKDEVKDKVASLKEHHGIDVTLAVILVGNDPASTVYVGYKKKACEYTGILSKSYELPEETKQFIITRTKAHEFVISGEPIIKFYRMTNISTDEGMMVLMTKLRKLRVDDELEKMGAVDGDIVWLDDFSFEYVR